MSNFYLEKYISNDSQSIIDFYDQFSDRRELLKWVASIPKSSPVINSVGDEESEIAVVIPTPSVNHPLALNCQNKIFTGLKIVFSVDNSVLFNLSRSYNMGAKSLSKCKNIKWIIFSNVDMVEISTSVKLVEVLGKVNDHIEFCYAKEQGSHSYNIRIGEYTKFRKIVFSLMGGNKRIRTNLEEKFSIQINAEDNRNMLTRGFVSNINSILNFGDFFIFSVDLLKKYNFQPFDELYLNGMEDVDLSFRIFTDLSRDQITPIDYNIGSLESGIRGRSVQRVFRSIPSISYFNDKMEKIL